MATQTLMTVEQFAALETLDTEDYELSEGELVPLSSGTWYHNELRDLIARAIWTYLDRSPVGKAMIEIDCRLSAGTVRRPDVSVFLNQNLGLIDRSRIPVPFAPDIAIEVLSPNERAMDVRRKTRDYLDAGSKEVWIIDHANAEAAVHTAAGVRYTRGVEILVSPVLPGFELEVSRLFV